MCQWITVHFVLLSLFRVRACPSGYLCRFKFEYYYCSNCLSTLSTVVGVGYAWTESTGCLGFGSRFPGKCPRCFLYSPGLRTRRLSQELTGIVAGTGVIPTFIDCRSRGRADEPLIAHGHKLNLYNVRTLTAATSYETWLGFVL